MSLLEEARRMAPSLSRGKSFVYILQLRSGASYVGCTSDVESRLAEHEVGRACRTTASDPPVAVLFLEVQSDFASARRRETQIKKWSRAKKEALIRGDVDLLKSLSKSRELQAQQGACPVGRGNCPENSRTFKGVQGSTP